MHTTVEIQMKHLNNGVQDNTLYSFPYIIRANSRTKIDF